MSEGFAAFSLDRKTQAAVARAQLTLPTPLQQKVIPPALLGRDIVAVSPPGSGRITSFLVPLIERLGSLANTRALVICRTKQRVAEVHAAFDKLVGTELPYKVTEILNNGAYGAQEQELRERRHLLIAQAERLIEHMSKGAVNFSSMEKVVLDGADELVADGLLDHMTRIVRRLPPRRQTIIFTRTLLPELSSFARQNLRDPIILEIAEAAPAPAPAEKKPAKKKAEKASDKAPAEKPEKAEKPAAKAEKAAEKPAKKAAAEKPEKAEKPAAKAEKSEKPAKKAAAEKPEKAEKPAAKAEKSDKKAPAKKK